MYKKSFIHWGSWWLLEPYKQQWTNKSQLFIYALLNEVELLGQSKYLQGKRMTCTHSPYVFSHRTNLLRMVKSCPVLGDFPCVRRMSSYGFDVNHQSFNIYIFSASMQHESFIITVHWNNSLHVNNTDIS